ncbi:MAG: ATP-binding protein [Proteobacteria bacterium]|nr:ATP-binding protein [Pseudomonadota bacterium]
MSQKKRLFERLESVLTLGEGLLRELAGSDPNPAVFEQAMAFRWETARGPGRLVPIDEPARFELDDLVGVDRAVEKLVRNTEQFVRALPCNHVLLYGERGTGKSSAVKGILERFAPRGLRLVELHKSQLAVLPRVLAAIRRAGGDYRFLVFCDDLSFDLGEPGYRELKAALEGSFEAPPENVCIIATSNRRHLLPETLADNRAVRVDEQGDLQIGEALDEKLALSDRFGLQLGFYAFDQKTYLAIVEHYAKRARLELSWDEIREQGLRWAVQRASRTGRTARQFVDDLAGRSALQKEADA